MKLFWDQLTFATSLPPIHFQRVACKNFSAYLYQDRGGITSILWQVKADQDVSFSFFEENGVPASLGSMLALAVQLSALVKKNLGRFRKKFNPGRFLKQKQRPVLWCSITKNLITRLLNRLLEIQNSVMKQNLCIHWKCLLWINLKETKVVLSSTNTLHI